MKIIESTNIDLIEPFPIIEAKRIFKWLQAYRNIVESDLSPKTEDEFEAYFRSILPHVRSFGVIDKNSALGFRHEAPLIGMIVAEPSTIWNSYLHIASNRRAWGTGFMDEAIITAINELFESTPRLQRLSAWVLANNGPVKGLARRLGFTFEGLMRDIVTQHGEPRSLIHFGFTRRDLEAAKLAAAAELAKTEPPAESEQKAKTPELIDSVELAPLVPLQNSQNEEK